MDITIDALNTWLRTEGFSGLHAIVGNDGEICFKQELATAYYDMPGDLADPEFFAKLRSMLCERKLEPRLSSMTPLYGNADFAAAFFDRFRESIIPIENGDNHEHA